MQQCWFFKADMFFLELRRFNTTTQQQHKTIETEFRARKRLNKTVPQKGGLFKMVRYDRHDLHDGFNIAAGMLAQAP